MDAYGHRGRRDSTNTAMSLAELDPSPIDSPTSSPSRSDQGLWSSQEYDMMESSANTVKAGHSVTGSTGSLGLSGGGGRGAIFYLSRIQRYSSYAMSIFMSLHLANVSLIPAVTRSVPGSETYLLMTREIYQTSITEPLLVGLPVLAHVGSGIAVRLLRRWQNMTRYGGQIPGIHAIHRWRTDEAPVRLWPPVSYISLSGYAFTLFYSAHVFMNRAVPLIVDGDSSNIGLAYVSHGFAQHPIVSRIAYLGLIFVGCGHMVWGMAKWLGISQSTKGWQVSERAPVDKKTRRQRRRKWLGVQGAALTVAALWAVGGLGVVSRAGPADGWVGKLYDGLFARVGL